MNQLEAWTGEFGDEYTERNAGVGIDARTDLWDEITKLMAPLPQSILEVGAGSGNNLSALRRVASLRSWDLKVPWLLSGVEPNAKARFLLEQAGFDAYGGTAANPGIKADLVFTSGVLVHIPPDELLASCEGIYGAADRYIVSIEYFAADLEEKPYRGHSGRLWKRDFGGYWLDNFDLEPLGCGFAWERMTGLDNLTWFAFRKC